MKTRFRKSLVARSRLIVFVTEPAAQPPAGVHIDRTVGLTDCSQTKVVGPTDQHSVERFYQGLRIQPDGISSGLVATWWQDVRQSQQAGTTEKRLRRFDGAYRWFRIAAAPVHDEQANLVRWCGINTDIDDLKCSEQKFRQETTDLRTITDAIRQSIAVLAADGTIMYVNQVFQETTGLTMREVNDKTLHTRVFHPDDLGRVLAERREGLLRGTPFEYEARLLMKDGQYRWWADSVQPVEGRTRPHHPLVRYGHRYRRPQALRAKATAK